MSAPLTQPEAYCSDLARRGDEDRWLAASYAPSPLRTALYALCAFRLELRRIPAAVSEPALGEIRLQWWRDALEEIRAGKPPRAHPVVEALASSNIDATQALQGLDGAIDAAARPLYGEPFESATAVLDWLKALDGAFDAFAASHAGGDNALTEAAGRAGAAFALAREGKALAPKLIDELIDTVLAQHREAAPVLEAGSSGVSPAFLHCALTPLYLRLGAGRFPIRKRLRLFSAMAFARF
ncbi:MAG: squalene/phytoene synthase family protein [Pseudomonadota bacterium]